MAGDDLVFAGTTRLTPNNDFAADTSFASITFSAGSGAFVIGGNRLTLAGNVGNSSAATQTITLAMIMAATRTFGGSGDLTVGGVLSGAGGLDKSGTGTLTLSGTNTYLGATTVNAGRLMVNGATDAASAVMVASGATLLGIGTVGGSVTVASGGILAPGTTSPLVASFVATSLRGTTQDDWRVSQTIAGTRNDATINLPGNAFGTGAERAALGIGGDDGNWENFSIQWDGYLRVVTAGTTLSTRSDDGSRVWLDLNGNGSIDSGEWGSNGWGNGQGETTGTVHANLPIGVYRMRIQYEEGFGGNAMYLLWNDAANSGGSYAGLYVVPANLLVGPAIGTLATGALTLSAGSTYSVDLNGTVPTYDQVNASGTATCTGTLSIGTLASPALGKVYTVVNAASISGTFSGLANNAIFAYQGRNLQIAYNASTVTLTDVAHPTTRVWDGGSASDSYWSTGANWDYDLAPVAGDDLQFAGSTRLTPSNDFAAGTSFASIAFNSGAGVFVLGPNSGANGSISREVWTGVGTTNISNIPLTTTPNISDTLSTFEAPTDWTDNYGTRVRGFLTAPTTGNYTFWIASDDEGQLWLSTDALAANKTLIASVPTWTSSREWTKDAAQKSVAIALVAGQQYYIEALQKEGGGGDNLAVGWAKPGEGTATPSEVIPGAWLAPCTTGSLVTLAGGITNSSASLQTVNFGLSLAATRTVNCSTGDITLGGQIAGAGGLTKTGGSTLTLGGANLYQGATTVSAGTLLVTGSTAAASAVTVANGATLGGTGTVAGTVTLSAGSTLAPGTGGTTIGTLVTGALTCNTTSALSIDLNGTAPSGDRVSSTGAVSLAGTLTVASIANAAYLKTYTIVSGSSISGTFSGLADQTTFVQQGRTFLIRYNATSVTLSDIDPAYVWVWDGGGADDNWRTAANWADDIAPAVGGALQFAGSTRTSPVNDYPASTSFASITFNSGAAAFTLTSGGNAITLASGVTNNSTNAQAINLAMAMAATRTFNAASGNLSVGGVLSGAGALTKTGTGTLTLTATNTFTGAVTISAGTLSVGDGVTDGAIATSSNIVDNGTLTYNIVGARTYANVISGSGTLTKAGAGTLTLSAVNTYAGSTTVTGGIISVSAEANLGATPGVATPGNLTLNGGTLQFTGTAAIVLPANRGIALGNAGGTINITIPTTASFAGTTDRGVHVLGIIADIPGQTGSLTVSGAGMLMIWATNTYSGATTVDTGWLSQPSAGSVSANMLATTTVMTLTNGGRFNLCATGAAQTLAGLGGDGTGRIGTTNQGSNVTLTLNESANYSFPGVIGALAHPGKIGNDVRVALVKSGSGIQTLGGVSTYTGTTTVNGGTLLVTGSLAAGSAVTVSSGGTLGGTGTVAGTVAVNAGATLAPGGSGVSIGTLSTGALTFSSTPTFSVDLDATAPSADRATSSGAVALTGTLTIANLANPSATYLQTYTIASGASLTGTFTGLPDHAVFTQQGRTFQITYTATAAVLTDLTPGYVFVWDGGGGDDNWTTAANWVGDLAPGSGAPLQFAGSTRLTPNNDFANDTAFASVTFNSGAGAFTLGGNRVALGGSLTNSSTVTQIVNLQLALAATRSVDTASGDLGISAIISGAGGLTKSGSGVLTLTAINTLTGAVTINAGTINVGNGTTDGSLATTSNIVNNGALVYNNVGNRSYANVISGTGTLTKLGSAQLTLSGTAANTFSGLTTVSAGLLTLSKTAGLNAIGGNLALAGGNLTFGASNQLPDTCAVIMSSASSTFNGTAANTGASAITDTFASLTVTGGCFNANTGTWTITGAMSYTGGAGNSCYLGNSASQMSVGSLSLTAMTGVAGATPGTANSFTVYGNNATRSSFTVGAGGITLDGSVLNMRRGGAGTLGSKLVVNGDITTTGTAASSIVEDTNGGTNGTITLELSGSAGAATRTVTVPAGGADLTIGVSITDGAATPGNLTKAGLGTLTFTGGTLANTYSGTTTVNDGNLVLQKTAGTIAIAGNISLGNASGSDVLRLGASNQIADTAVITFLSGGGGNSAKLELNGYVETVAGIQSNASQASVIQNTESGAAAGATNPAILTISNTADYVYDGLIRNGGGGSIGIAKAGSGTLTLRSVWGPTLTSFTGASSISAGRLVVDDLNVFNPAIANSSAAANALTFNQSTQNLSHGGVISGSGALTKTGTGTLTLGGANTWTGATTVSAGTLKAAVASVANVSGAFGNNSPVTLANAAGVALDITGFNTQIGALAGGGMAGGNVTLGAATLTTGGANLDATYHAVIGGTGSLIKIGTGTLSLTNSHTYGGSTTISGGVLKLRAAPHYRYYRFVPTVFKGGAGINCVQLSELQLLLGGTWIPAVAATNPGGNNPAPEGPANANDNNTATKWLDFNKLPLVYDFGSSTAFDAYDWATANDVTDRDALRWRIEGSDDNATWTIIDDRTAADQSITDTRLTFVAPAVVHFPLYSYGADLLPTTTALAIASGASLDLGGSNQQVASLADSGGGGGTVTNNAANNAVLTIGGASSTTFSGVLVNGSTNQVALTQGGSGTLTLSGASTYTGATTLNSGTVLVTGSLAAGSAVAVNSGGALGGSGTVAGAITVASGGALVPGTGGTTIATLTTGAVGLGASATYAVDLNGTTPTFDRITSSGVVACNGTLTIASIANAAVGRSYIIASGIGSPGITGTFSGLPDSTLFVQAGRLFRITYGSNAVTLTDVAPVTVTRQTMDVNGDGQIDRVRLTFDQALNDDFSGLTVTVAGYTVTGFSTGTANDAVVDVLLTQSGTPDSGATPSVRITTNTSLKDVTGTALVQVEGSGTAASDGAAPVLLSAAYTDGDANGVDAGDTLVLTFSETVVSASMVPADLGLPVTNDTLSTSTIADQSGATAITVALDGTPQMTPGGAYSSAVIGDARPSGVFIASGAHLHDLAASPNAAATGNAASAVDVGSTPATVVDIEWNDTHDTANKLWAVGNVNLNATYASGAYTIRNIGVSSVALAAACSDSTSATTTWSVQPAPGANQFRMKADASAPLDGLFELTLGNAGAAMVPFVRSGNTRDFSLQFATPTVSATAAQQTITVTITATQY